jgi:hypothetical protein
MVISGGEFPNKINWCGDPNDNPIEAILKYIKL